jgi:isocitrate lyase
MSETDINNISNIHRMNSSNWSSINPEYVKRMRVQNQFQSGIDIAKYTASIMRRDMDDYDGMDLLDSKSLFR